MKKRIITVAAAGLLVAAVVITGFAGEWMQDQSGSWYQNDDGSYAKDGWSWIDGRCYYFTPEGYCLKNTTTPDGYLVDENGAWIVDGVVQTQEDTGGDISEVSIAAVEEEGNESLQADAEPSQEETAQDETESPQADTTAADETEAVQEETEPLQTDTAAADETEAVQEETEPSQESTETMPDETDGVQAAGSLEEVSQTYGTQFAVNGLVFITPPGFIKDETTDAISLYFYNSSRDGAIAVRSEVIPSAEQTGTSLEKYSEGILDKAMNQIGTPVSKVEKQFPTGKWYCYQYDSAEDYGITGGVFAYGRISGTRIQMVMFMGNVTGVSPDEIMMNYLR